MICAVLDPRWKNFSYLQRFSYQQHVESSLVSDKLQAFEAKHLAYSLLKQEFDNLSGGVTEQTSINHRSSKQKEFDLFDILVTNNHLNSSDDDNNELFKYECEPEVNRNENPLEW